MKIMQVEVSQNATISLVNAEKVFTVAVSKSGQFEQIIEELNLRLLPDEYFAAVYTSTGSGDLVLGTRWKELF